MSLPIFPSLQHKYYDNCNAVPYEKCYGLPTETCYKEPVYVKRTRCDGSVGYGETSSVYNSIVYNGGTSYTTDD